MCTYFEPLFLDSKCCCLLIGSPLLQLWILKRRNKKSPLIINVPFKFEQNGDLMCWLLFVPMIEWRLFCIEVVQKDVEDVWWWINV